MAQSTYSDDFEAPSAQASPAQSLEFFAPIAEPASRALGKTKTPGSVADTTSSTGLMSIMGLTEDLPDSVQTVLNHQKKCLVNLAGMASAYVRKQASDTKNPDLVFDPGIWKQVYLNLPLMGPAKFEKSTFSDNIKGVEISTKFLAIMGIAIDPATATVLSSFTNFLDELGKNIRLGIRQRDKGYSFGAIGIAIEGIQVGNQIDVLGWLKGYFITFTQSQTKVFTSCGSYEQIDISFDYKQAVQLFNYEALEDTEVANEFNDLIRGTQIDDVGRSKKFFGGSTPRGAKDIVVSGKVLPGLKGGKPLPPLPSKTDATANKDDW